MEKARQGEAGKGRRAKRALPGQMPDTPENVARSLLNAPPKKRAERDYLRKQGAADSSKDGWNCPGLGWYIISQFIRLAGGCWQLFCGVV